MEANSDFWILELDRVRREYLDILFLGVPVRERICPNGHRSYVALMSPEEVQRDHDSWMEVLNKVKENGTIQDIILIIQLMKETNTMIDAYRTFCPIGNVLSFFGTALEGEEWRMSDEETHYMSMKIFQTYLRLGLEEEEELIHNNLEAIEEIISTSQNPQVVNYFLDKIRNYHEELGYNLENMLDM